MNKIVKSMVLSAALWCLSPIACHAGASKVDADMPQTFEAGKGTFMLNGEPFVVKAAELHYPRIPKPYWDQRIKLCKALGMNTVCLYVFWNAHEPEPDVYDFEGQNDLAEFVRLCKENDMYVILRPGPYVCAEWEMGGLPWWLLKKKDIRLREMDPYFVERVGLFEEQVAKQVEGLTIKDGGPIIMVQVENEYGSYGIDKEYVSTIRDIVRKNFGDVTLFQCDWSSNFTNNGLDDLIWTMNFGTGANIDQQFARLKELRPDSPLMCSEFWSGWFDKWGANHETRPAEDMIAGIDEMLSKGISFSLYMTHGGTNWGHFAGANSPGFAPDVTSYDYDAPISESGQTTPKYWQLRETLAKYADGKLPKVPATIKPVSVPEFKLIEVAPLFNSLPKSIRSEGVMTFEDMDQGFGSMLYRTLLPKLENGATLTVNDAHDYAQVFVNGKYIGKLDRRNGEKMLSLPPTAKGDTLDILVEAMGRINFGRAIKDYKGITDNVVLTIVHNGHEYFDYLKNWEIFPLPDKLDFYNSMEYFPIEAFTAGDNGRLPIGVYRGTFNVKKPSDTFLNFETWGKGLVYVNGHPLGRIWEIGPQQTLYAPGCWLKKGENEILVFDIVGPREAKSAGLESPLLDQLLVQKPLTHRTEGESLSLSGETPVLSASFKPGNGWQEAKFDKPVTGRYVCLEALNAIDGKDLACIAEMYLLNDKGERLSREPWIVDYADSEDVARVNRSADKIFDLQESTYWSTESGAKFPHSIVIDLGATHKLSGLQYLPRMESDVPGAIKDYKVYVSDKPFKK
ncbi:MAG: beta-galactosidase [Muribaculum sp.]|nr:beta-galactosidase [Muribaculum sp.]